MENYSLRKLQAAYLKVTLRKEEGKGVCLYCWKSNCGCNSHTTPQNDSFITLTTISEFQNA